MIDAADIERLKEIFVTRKECDDTMDDVNSKLSNDMKELAVINTKLSLILWFLGAVGAAVITVLVKLFFGGKV
jgi:hypothetical protein